MDDKVIRLTATDFEETMDFLNMVFSMSSRPHHFQTLLPKLYQPDDLKMQAHFAIRRQGKLRAVIGLYPMELRIGSQVLKAGGIGGVSTHPEERKSGLMRRLMQAVVSELETEDYALSILGGQRQRYGYYGYEKIGSSLSFDLSKTNLRHFFSNQEYNTIRFEPVDGGDEPASLALTQQMKNWYDSLPVHVERPLASYMTILNSWYAQTWLARNAGGEAVGYLVCDRKGTQVSELITAKPDWLLSVAAAWVDRLEETPVTFILAPWQQDAVADLSRLAENCGLHPAKACKILDWPGVLTGLLNVKACMQAIPEGRLRLGIEDKGQVRVFELAYQNGQASCRLCARNEADLVFDHLTATRLLLGPLPPSLVIPQQMPADSKLSQLLALWLPLPFFWPLPDSV